MAEEYRKIRKEILEDIADAIRTLRRSEKQYNPNEFAGVLRKLLVLPSDFATSRLTLGEFRGNAVGVLPTVYEGVAASRLSGMSFNSSANGALE